MAGVLDACALVAFAKEELQSDTIEKIIEEDYCYITSVNAAEFFYMVRNQAPAEPKQRHRTTSVRG